MPLPDLLNGAGGRNVLVRAREGFMLANRHDIVVGRSIIEYGEYYQSEVNTFAELLNASGSVMDTAVDVGANMGTHTLALSRLVGEHGRVVAVEPQREMFRLLSANLALNGVRNVEAIWGAADSYPHQMLMPEINYEVESSFGGVHAGLTPEGVVQYEVPAVTLDDMLLGHASVRLIKIDVEGHEISVLRGAIRVIETHLPVLYVENDRPDNSRELLELISSFGYRMFWHLPVFHNPENFAKRKVPIHGFGFHETSQEDRWGTIGFGINMLCVHESQEPQVNIPEALDFDFHPMWKRCTPGPKAEAAE